MESVRLSTTPHTCFTVLFWFIRKKIKQVHCIQPLFQMCTKAKERAQNQCQSSPSFSKHTVYEYVYMS